jgi:hypothetical protein
VAVGTAIVTAIPLTLWLFLVWDALPDEGIDAQFCGDYAAIPALFVGLQAIAAIVIWAIAVSMALPHREHPGQ